MEKLSESKQVPQNLQVDSVANYSSSKSSRLVFSSHIVA